jgi:hypothetical protein
MVHPFLGICKEICFVLDPAVSSIIELPLSVFLNDEILIKAKMLTSYAKEINVHLILKDMLYGVPLQ